MAKKSIKAAKDAEEIGSSKELYNFLYEACNTKITVTGH